MKIVDLFLLSRRGLPAFVLVLAAAAPWSLAQDGADCIDRLQCESSWLGLTAEERDAVFEFAEEYKDFIHLARTELSFVEQAIAFAEANGFEALTDSATLVPGSRIYEVNRDRTT